MNVMPYNMASFIFMHSPLNVSVFCMVANSNDIVYMHVKYLEYNSLIYRLLYSFR